ncbi:high choriolytic enzyme 1-like [Bemisia tabaci]|uniref:high choriolytic enzyme 1-like n=1 Tax=Bemisia tabaci TaxID=7038 RepID=UPI003B28760D
MKAWSDKTCIRFKQRSGEHDWVRIFHNETQFGCSADNGRQGGEQELSCGPGQWHHRILMHELGHVLTLKHDHQRPDRDKYVKVIDQNIKPGFENQFEIKDRSEFNILGLPYDRHSVMAYGASTFSKVK